MSLAALLSADRRLVVLRCLEEDSSYALNEDVLRKGLAYLGHAMTRDQVRGEITWLEQQNLVRIEKLAVASGELWLVRATSAGVDVARGVTYPGVARPDPR